jgi:hypothetical protein
MAMNIGALAWYAAPELTDLMALGDREALALVRARRLDSAAVRRLADQREIDFALIFDDWYASTIGGGPPLVKVATLVSRTDWPTPLSIYVRNEHGGRLAVEFLKMTKAERRLAIEFESAFR